MGSYLLPTPTAPALVPAPAFARSLDSLRSLALLPFHCPPSHRPPADLPRLPPPRRLPTRSPRAALGSFSGGPSSRSRPSASRFLRRRSPTVLFRPPAMPQPHPCLPCPTPSSPSRSLPSVPLIPLLLHPSHLSLSPAAYDAPRRKRSWLDCLFFALLLVVLGTVAVLSTANSYFGIYPLDVILPSEVASPFAPSRVPRIIHQTWKTLDVPPKWVAVRESCAALHDDWEYMLWTDDSGRDLIARKYPWFLDTYDGYRYPIQRADAVRYFILHHYGGVYMDLDIGCLRPMDSLLRFDMVLPQTTPVGISNDLMFSTPGHPFMDFVIHRLAKFDYNYCLNYATVMFSTGPMALSALLSQFRSSFSPNSSPGTLFGPVRVLPPKMYGKNLPSPQPHPGPFFSHYYGSSWHTDGAKTVLWLGKFGIFLLYGASAIVLVCGLRVGMALLNNRRSGEPTYMALRPWSPTSLSKPHSRGIPLWKRRISGTRRAEAKFLDAILLPAHWVEKAATSSASKHFCISKSLLNSTRHAPCRCHKPDLVQTRLDANELPPYDSSEVSGRESGVSDLEMVLEHGCCDLGHTEGDSDQLLASHAKISEANNSSQHPYSGGVCSSTMHDIPAKMDAGGLPSPLQKAIHRLAELAGMVGEGRSGDSSQLPGSPCPIDELGGSSGTVQFKVD